jgi:16S rRNA (guanine527-N7)-methyltransferase
MEPLAGDDQGAPPPPATPAPPPPPEAVAFFGDRLDLICAYADLLADAGVERGLLGPREVDRLWERHILNCAAVAPGLPSGATVGDLGSGAGLPGLVVAIARPDVQVTLIEPLLRRATFLSEAVAALKLPNATVLRTRAEDHPPGPGYDFVLARAVAALDLLAGWALPLLRPNGWLWAIKGENANAELDAALKVLTKLGASEWEPRWCRLPGVEPPTVVLAVRAGAPAPAVSRETKRRPRAPK